MSEGFSSATEWAEQVRPDEPHSLADLEDHVMGRGEGSLAKIRAAEPLSAWGCLAMAGYVVLLAGPVGAATVFWDRSQEVRQSYSFDNAFAFPAAAIGSTFGVIVVAACIVGWARGDRRRDGTLFWLSAAVAVCAGLTLLQGRRESLSGSIPEQVYLSPAWIGLALGLVTAAVGALAPAPDRELAEERRRREELHRAKLSARRPPSDGLHPKHVEVLLADRRAALEALASRGLLETSVGELARRPLGELSPTGDAARSDD